MLLLPLLTPAVGIAKIVEAPVLNEKTLLTTKGGIDLYINYKATEEGVSPAVVKKVIECESQYNVNALGDSGHSRGLVQIHNKYHPEVSDEEAYDAQFAVDFLVQKLKEGRGKEWTCWRHMK